MLDSQVRAVSFWLKITQMDNNRIPKMAYLRDMKEINKKGSWAQGIKKLLDSTGFSEVWATQGTGMGRSFLKQLKTRLQDIYIQEWTSKCRDSDRCKTYKDFKHTFGREKYIIDIDISKYRQSLARLRVGACDLNINKKFTSKDPNVNCPFCDTPETEIHFLLNCPAYDDLRHKYIATHFPYPLNTTLAAILQNDNKLIVQNLGMYTYHALRERGRLMEQDDTSQTVEQ